MPALIFSSSQLSLARLNSVDLRSELHEEMAVYRLWLDLR
jgi:hypothetical protein